MVVSIDTRERYGWKFPKATIDHRSLKVGDYALLHDEAIAAVVERKTLQNFLQDIVDLKPFHLALSHLEAYEHNALVIEAHYGDIYKPTKAKHHTPEYLANIIGEISALHPRLKIHWAGNRKLANIWAQNFFGRVAAGLGQAVAVAARADEKMYEYVPATGGVEIEIKRYAMNFGRDFYFEDITAKFPTVKPEHIRAGLKSLVNSGKLVLTRKGRKNLWSPPAAAAKSTPAAPSSGQFELL